MGRQPVHHPQQLVTMPASNSWLDAAVLHGSNTGASPKKQR